MTECKSCEYFDLLTGKCLIDYSKYKNGCLHYNCTHYEDAKRCSSYVGYTKDESEVQ